MGATNETITWLTENRALFQGKKIITLGRVHPFISSKSERSFESLYGRGSATSARFASTLFELHLGVSTLHELDVSDYQGAEVIHDLNLPISAEYHGAYDVVYDPGTIEHISNQAEFLKNIFNILGRGGLYILGAPGNGWVDHGFFQYSPTFFEDFCNANDFELVGLDVVFPRRRSSILLAPHLIKAVTYSSSPNRFTISGVIRKTSMHKNLNLNFMQKKYVALHKESAPHKSGPKKIISRIFTPLFLTPLLPFFFRLMLARLAVRVAGLTK